MAEDTPSKDDKTEEPTPYRLEQAREKGQFPISREITNLAVIAGGAVVILLVFPWIGGQIAMILRPFLSHAHIMAGAGGDWVHPLVSAKIQIIFIVLMAILAIVMIFIIVGGGLQTRFSFSPKALSFKAERISLLKGAKRLFSGRSLIELIKGLLKIILMGSTMWMVIRSDMDRINHLSMMSLSAMGDIAWLLMQKLFLTVLSLIFLLSIFDYIYQYFDFMKNMRMTRQEIKEEYKQLEGNPIIKGKVKQIRMERARQKMMTQVPSATVVITNPTHYAVALLYDMETMNAPIVVAKGIDYLALQIRFLAEENNVPIIENPPLAQSLYKSVDINKMIPPEHYQTVAEIIRYVMRLSRFKPRHHLRKS